MLECFRSPPLHTQNLLFCVISNWSWRHWWLAWHIHAYCCGSYDSLILFSFRSCQPLICSHVLSQLHLRNALKFLDVKQSFRRLSISYEMARICDSCQLLISFLEYVFCRKEWSRLLAEERLGGPLSVPALGSLSQLSLWRWSVHVTASQKTQAFDSGVKGGCTDVDRSLTRWAWKEVPLPAVNFKAIQM